MRRLRRKLTIQRGKPSRPANAEGGAGIERRAAGPEPIAKTISPQITLKMKKVRRLQFRPACSRRRVSGGELLRLACAFCFSSISFSVSCTDFAALGRVDDARRPVDSPALPRP